MAENKKSFILYSDYKSVFNELTNEEAGVLIKHIFSYVNDENQILQDRLLKITFEPIRLQLKRDLVKWDELKKRQSEKGKKGGRPKSIIKPKNPGLLDESKQKPENPSLISESQKSLNVTVTDTVNVNESGSGKYRTPPQSEVEKLFIGMGGTKSQAAKFYLYHKSKGNFETMADWTSAGQKWFLEDREKINSTNAPTW